MIPITIVSNKEPVAEAFSPKRLAPSSTGLIQPFIIPSLSIPLIPY
jgi:hypothetical protein